MSSNRIESMSVAHSPACINRMGPCICGATAMQREFEFGKEKRELQARLDDAEARLEVVRAALSKVKFAPVWEVRPDGWETTLAYVMLDVMKAAGVEVFAEAECRCGPYAGGGPDSACDCSCHATAPFGSGRTTETPQ